MKYISVLSVLLAVVLSACGGSAGIQAADVHTTNPVVNKDPAEFSSTSNPESDTTSVSEQGYTVVDLTALSTAIAPLQSGTLSEAEVDALNYMREEEKLAHDVYITLFDQWQLPVFHNIANSELSHTEAVKTLLDRYGLPDPASAEVGSFTDQTLQSLYDQLVTQGSQSLAEALKVGAAIEEFDILDLEARIAQTDKADIILVFENLMKGSRNHLRSFVSTLQTQSSETYQPQYMSPDAYQTIITATIDSGRQGNPGGKGSGSGKPQPDLTWLSD